jgi:dihydropyrimidinase
MCPKALEKNEKMSILVKNGTIVTSKKISSRDILISEGRVNRIGVDIETSAADKVIDATGHFVFPGGIDPHVHMHLPGPAGFSADDFYTGSRAALFGGTTTLLDFVTPQRGQSLTEALQNRMEEAKVAMTDYSFHVSPVEWRNTTAQEIRECSEAGVSSFKVYMAYKDTIGLSDNDLFNVMKAVGKAGRMVTVHCEDGDGIEKLRNQYFREHHTGAEFHPLSRPPEMEAATVEKAIRIANKAGCPLYIVHVSSGQSLKYIQLAQEAGQKVYSETCPQYLLLDDSRYRGDFASAAPFVMSPPLRKKEDNAALWDAISAGIIHTIGTDHCPFNMSQKKTGSGDFRKIPNGAGGVEHRLALLYTYGMLAKRVSIHRMVDLFSTAPAKIFGLYPSKGEILEGSEADLVIWDPEPERTISVKSHHQHCDNNIYEGIKTKGKANWVIAGGRVVIENGKLTDPDFRGKFIKR